MQETHKLQDVSFNAGAVQAEGDLTFREGVHEKHQQLSLGESELLLGGGSPP